MLNEPHLVRYDIYADARGTLGEVWKSAAPVFAQINHTMSFGGALRGLHYSRAGQGKLVTCVEGVVQDAVVDFRTGSPTFGKPWTFRLSCASAGSVWVPPGFGHGFLTVTATSRVLYALTSPHSPDDEGTVSALDPFIAIEWEEAPPYTMSPRDTAAPLLVKAAKAGLLSQYKD